MNFSSIYQFLFCFSNICLIFCWLPHFICCSGLVLFIISDSHYLCLIFFLIKMQQIFFFVENWKIQKNGKIKIKIPEIPKMTNLYPAHNKLSYYIILKRNKGWMCIECKATLHWMNVKLTFIPFSHLIERTEIRRIIIYFDYKIWIKNLY